MVKPSGVKRPVVVTVGLAAMVGAILLVWVDVRRERDFRRLVALGDAALGRDETSVAIESFSGAIALRSESMLAHLKRGDTYRRRGELPAALRDLRTAAALDPSATRPLELLGDVAAVMDRQDEAASYYQRYLVLEDRAPAVLYKLAGAWYRSGRAERAIDPLRKAIALDREMVEAHHLLGMALRGLGRRADAEQALARALELDRAYTPAREELAGLLPEVGRRRDGIEQLEALAALEPARPERLVSVGLAYARLGRLETAILTLGRALDRFPDSTQVRAALGYAWLEMAESGTGVDTVALGRARAALEDLAGRPDATSDTLTHYGRALLLAGNAVAAEPVLREASSRFPVEPTAFRYLADAARRLRHDDIAADADRQYAALTGQ